MTTPSETWQVVTQSEGEETSVLRIPAGWLYSRTVWSHTSFGFRASLAVSIVFVPERS